MRLNNVIKTAKKLIDLPYNSFSLETYFKILLENKLNPITIDTDENQPIKLMSGNNFYARIVTTNYDKLNKKRIILIGKGILFDSGGLNIKPSEKLDAMTDDKAGMIVALSVANYLKGNVIAYCPVTTNFIQTSKIIPGDIIKIGNKNVKVTNTDAEGRLILAEAISTLNISKNDIVITVATLTGSVGYAIGDVATGVFSDNSCLLQKYAEASDEADELAWALPMFDYMQDFYKKEPIKNSIEEFKGGASQGAMFIKQFLPYPNQWIHLDIASSSFDKQGRANGVPIKSLINFIKKLQ
jgi:leucyl aminopeptidase